MLRCFYTHTLTHTQTYYSYSIHIMNTRSQSGRENRQTIPPRGATGSRGRGRGTRGRGGRVTP